MPYGMTGSNYAAGDYYQGDYYQGDPGFLGSLFKGVTGAIGGFISGGPVGAVVGGTRGLLGRSSPTAPPPGTAVIPFSGGPVPVLPPPPFQTGFGIQTGTMRIGAFGQSQKEGQLIGGGMAPGIPTIRGLHYNKSTYETRGGGTSRWGPSGSLQVHPKGTVLVKSRRMNVGNARALKRALRRARGFERLARSVMVVHRFKKHPTRRVGRKR